MLTVCTSANKRPECAELSSAHSSSRQRLFLSPSSKPLTPTCAVCNTCGGIPRCRAAVMVGELHQSRRSAQEPCFPVCVSFLNPPASLNSSSGQASCYARRGPREPSNGRIRTRIISLISVAINHTRLLLKIVLKELCKWITIFSKDSQKLNVCLPGKTLYQ